MIYGINGETLYSAFNVSADELDNAFSVDGNVVFNWPKTFSVLGDSYSAFEGDVYPSTNRVWYTPGKNGVETKSDMWLNKLATLAGLTLVHNASWSGSPICYDGYGTGTSDGKEFSFVARCNDVGDAKIIFVFGGTNDSWIGVQQGSYIYSGWTESDLEKFRPALAFLLNKLKIDHPLSTILFIKNTGLSTAIQESISTVCSHYSVPIIVLSNIEKSNSHPTANGMIQICNQVYDFLEAM